MTELKNIKISYNVFESTEGSDAALTPIIFMHGMMASKEMWDKIPQAIADKTKRKIYACDCREHGASEYTGTFSFDLTVEDLWNFMDRMKIPKAILVGHSMGGITSTIAALRKPERVEMIFPVDIFLKKVTKELPEKITQWATLMGNTMRSIPKETPESEVAKTFLKRLDENIPEDSGLQTEKESVLNIKIIFRTKPDGGYDVAFNDAAMLKFARETDEVDLLPDGQFKGPAYFIYGTKSQFQVNKQEADIKMHFPEAKLIPFEGASHNVYTDFPDKFVETLLDHL